MTTPAYQYIINSGVIVPDTSVTLAEVQNEWTDALGADLIVTPDTPQGVMITAEALARNNVINNNAGLANQINPNIAGGIFLDAIMALTGTQRNIQQPTVVSGVALTGVPGTVIPVGAQATTAAGDLFQLTSTVTLSGMGTATGTFQSVEYGPIPCATSALSIIVTAILGWETVTNGTAGVLGATTQSDQAARAFRLNTLGFQGLALAAAITSAVYAVPGVTSLTFQENIASGSLTINGVGMVGHSIYTCVAGGTDTAVAAALLENKSSGCAWNGGTMVDLVEPASGQTYAVQFDRPELITILVQMTVANISAAEAIQAILDYAAGNINGLQGFVVGGDVSPFELSGAVMAENPGAYVSSCTISLTSPLDYTTSPIEIGVNQQATIAAGNITITIGG